MPFICIPGSFHLVGRTASGKPAGLEPDGDSIHFRPDDPALLDRLERQPGGQKFRLLTIGSLNLRMEGIDALEIHYTPSIKGAHRSHQPREFADAARDALTGLLDMNPVPYAQPANVRVKPPVPVDGVRGAILSRALDVHGRPVSFLFAGKAPARSGAEVRLGRAQLRRSLNYRMVAAGAAYPLFYDTLFKALRDELADAAIKARGRKAGIWRADLGKSGLKAASQADLEARAVIFPKLFRRLTDYFAEGNAGPGGFIAWLAATGGENDQVMEPSGNFTHFDNVVSVKRGKVALRYRPEEMVFISRK